VIHQPTNEEIKMSSITYEVTVSEYYTVWKLDGKFHREDGPAIEWANGSKSWYINGKYHREDGPAIEASDGYKAWCLDGIYHRNDGPAIEAYGSEYWYLNGEELTEEEHRVRTQPAVEMTVAEIEQLLGKRIKVVK
jgi:hypothetical protein